MNAKITNPQGTVVVGYNAIADAISIASWAAVNGYAIHIANPDGTATPPQYGSGTNSSSAAPPSYRIFQGTLASTAWTATPPTWPCGKP
ncbi:MAG: hypothetical protein LBT32_02410 [Peptococcaceae bacterium]|nr:hypothetical protein [Peptococcaceae bacterium]